MSSVLALLGLQWPIKVTAISKNAAVILLTIDGEEEYSRGGITQRRQIWKDEAELIRRRQGQKSVPCFCSSLTYSF